jgi:regulatory protein
LALSDSDALAAALRLLARRGRSENELAGRLQQKGFSEEAITSVMARCRQLGYLDDARFARERARELMRGGRAVGRRVLVDLQQRGIAEANALAAVEEAAQEFGEDALLAELRRRRFPDFAWPAADDRQRQRVVNFFLRRGFSLTRVLAFLRER